MTGRNLLAQRKDGSQFPVEIGLSPLTLGGNLFVLASLFDQTERKQIGLLYRLNVALASSEDLYHSLRAFVNELKQMLTVDAFHIGLYDSKTDVFSYSLFINLGEDFSPPSRKLQEKPGLTWEVISKQKTLYIEDTAKPNVQKEHHIVVVVDAPIRSYLGIPLMAQGQAIGVMSVQALTPNAYNQNQIRLLETIAAQVVITIEKSRLLQQLQQELAKRRLLIEELENKNAELERFTYTVSHDLRSPLVTINGFLGFLEQSAKSGNMQQFEKDKTRIEAAVQRMQNLLKELLELSRIGRKVNPSVDIPFEDIVKDAIDILQGQIRKREVTLQTHPNLPTIHGDRQRLTEVLQNLIDNAIKYMGNQPNPIIEIGQQGEEDNKPIFFVKDNGIGIAPEHHERIFNLFEQLDPYSDGTGVGLALVKRIIEIHGGKIWVQSEANKGTTFYFTLPTGSD